MNPSYDPNTFVNFHRGFGQGMSLFDRIQDARERKDAQQRMENTVAYMADQMGVNPAELEGLNAQGLSAAYDTHLARVKEAAAQEQKMAQMAVIEKVVRPQFGDAAAARAEANMYGIGTGIGQQDGDLSDMLKLLNIDAGLFNVLSRDAVWSEDPAMADRVDMQRERVEDVRGRIADRIGLDDAADAERARYRDDGTQESGQGASFSPATGSVATHEQGLVEPADKPAEFSEAELDDALEAVERQAAAIGAVLTEEQLVQEAMKLLRQQGGG